jgi:putative tryptophan/tyrosine transport system substrate-binding protein
MPCGSGGISCPTDAGGPDNQAKVAAFRQALWKLGWTEGRNIQIALRWGEGNADHIRADAAELAATAPDVLVGDGGPPVSELRRLTNTIPIVFVEVQDPVELGVVTSLAHPGADITGFTHFELAMGGKWLEMLKEISPHISRIAFLLPPEHPAWSGFLRTITAAASSLGLEVTPAGVHDAAEIKRAVEAFAREPTGGLIVLCARPR